METKQCSACRDVLDVIFFSKNKSRADGIAHECRRCRKTKNAEWYGKNREKACESARKWNADHADHAQKRLAAYRAAHRDEAIVRSSTWYSEHKDLAVLRARVTLWEKNAIYRAQDSCKKTGREMTIDVAHVKALFEKQRGLCYWTGVPMVPSVEKRDPQRPSLDRLDNAIGYVPGNVVLATQFANIGRQTATAERFAEFLETLRAAIAGTRAA